MTKVATSGERVKANGYTSETALQAESFAFFQRETTPAGKNLLSWNMNPFQKPIPEYVINNDH